MTTTGVGAREQRFEPWQTPFPKWLGPFSPRRGTRTGYTVRDKKLWALDSRSTGSEEWEAVGEAALELARFVYRHFGGGRVLVLPGGLVVKPLQQPVGERVLIGRMTGAFVLRHSSSGQLVDMGAADEFNTDDPWPAPYSIGLECVMQADGCLRTDWYNSAAYGVSGKEAALTDPDAVLAALYRVCADGQASGRVHLTAEGHVLAPGRDDGNGVPKYVTFVSPTDLIDESSWIEDAQ